MTRFVGSITFALLASCGVANAQATVITVTPSTLNLSGNPGELATGQFTVTASPAAQVTIAVSSASSSWLSVDQSKAQTPATIKVTANTNPLAAGNSYTGTITVSAAGAVSKGVTVNFKVGATGLEIFPSTVGINVSPGKISSGNDSTNIINIGPKVSFSVNVNDGWLRVSLSSNGPFTTSLSGTLDANNDPGLELFIQADARGFDASNNPYVGHITITAPGRPTQVVTVNLKVNGVAIALNPPNLTIVVPPGGSNTGTFYASVISGGNTSQIDVGNPTQSWLQVNPIHTNAGVNITLTATAGNRPAGTYMDSVNVSAQGSGPSLDKTLFVTMQVKAAATLSSNPLSLTLTSGGTSNTATGQIQVATDSDPVPFTVSTTPSWLTASPLVGTATTTLRVTADLASPGASGGSGSITITPSNPAIRSLTIPVNVARLAPASRRYTIPQIADGGAYQTSIILTNTGVQPVVVSLSFHRSSDPVAHATQPWNIAMVNNAAVQNVTIAPGTSYTLQTAAQDPNDTSIGWGEVVASGPISGFAVFRQQVSGTGQEAAVPVNVDGVQRFYLPYDLQNYQTTMAIANLSATDQAPITVTFRSVNGSTRIDNLGTIPPQGHWAFRLVDQFSYLANDKGVAEFSAPTGQLSVLGLRYEASEFTSFEAQYPNAPAATRYSIPQVADGGVYRTSFVVVNTGTSPVTASLRFYRSDPFTHATQPWNPPMVGNAATQNVTINPGTSYTVQTAASDPNVAVGWGEVLASGPVTGFAVFRQQIDSVQEAAVPINADGAQREFLAYDNQQGFHTSLAVVNLSATETAHVTMTFRSVNGSTRTETLGDIPPQGHWAFRLEDSYTYLKGDRGVAEFDTPAGQLSILGLRFNPSGALTSFRAFPPLQ